MVPKAGETLGEGGVKSTLQEEGRGAVKALVLCEQRDVLSPDFFQSLGTRMTFGKKNPNVLKCILSLSLYILRL